MVRKFSNSAWAIGEHLWYPLLVFATTPVFLGHLGAERYGLWMLLNATVGVGAILNTGTGAATIKLVSEQAERNGQDRVGTILRNAIAVALLGGGITGVLVFAVYGFGAGLFFGKMGDPQLVILTGGVAAILTWIEQIDNVFASAVKGAEKFGRIARLEMASKSIQVLGALAAVLAGGGLKSLYATMLLVSTGRLIAKAQLVRSALGVGSLSPSFTRVNNFLRLSVWGWLQGLGAALFNSVDRFVVGSIFGAAALSHYSIALMLPQQIHAVAAAGLSVVFPMVSRKAAANATGFINRFTVIAMLGVLLASATVAAFLLLYGERIFMLWLRTPLPAEALGAFNHLVVAYVILAMNIVPHYVFLGLGRLRFVALANLFAGVISLAMLNEFAGRLGLVGVADCRMLYAVLTFAGFVPLLLGLRKESSPLEKSN